MSDASTPTSSRPLRGRVAVVTGSTSGIGLGVAEALAAQGATIVLNGFGDQVQIEDIRKSLARMHDVAAFYHGADLSKRDAVYEMMAYAAREAGDVDILVNNAGITRDNLVMRLKDEDWDDVLNANLRGAFAAIRAVVRGMMKKRNGRIINMASVVGLNGNKGQANYAASKAGLIALTKSVAKELGSRNILVNAIAPGFIETEMTDAMTPEAKAALNGLIPLERLGKTEDIASAVVFLASDSASYITGQVLVVDGGMVM